MTKKKEKLAQEAKEKLLKILNPGDTVYTILRHVSRSGMSRRISIYVFLGEMICIDDYVADVLGWPYRKDGIVVGGCGMDAGFHLVHTLAQTLFSNGYSLKQRWL